MAYRGLILDFGGVVTTDFNGALAAFCVREGLAPGAFLHVLRDTAEGRDAMAAVECGELPQRDYERVIARLLDIPAEGLLGKSLADLRPRPGILDLARHARAAGIRTGVLSNSLGTGSYDPYQGWDLDLLVDSVVISHQVGLRKPDPAVYLLTAEKIGIPPGECVFADDTAANLPAARALGMAVVHFTDEAADIAEIRSLLGLG